MSDDRNEDHDLARARTMREKRTGVTTGVGGALTNVVRFPGHQRPQFDRMVWFREYHGLVPGESVCDGCGREVKLEDTGRCAGCGKPYPYRCHGFTMPIGAAAGSVSVAKCMSMLYPVPHQVTNARGVVLTAWDDTERSCGHCVRESRRITRAMDWLTAFRRAGGDERERAARKEILPNVQGYEEHRHRAELDAAIEDWLSDRAQPSMFVWGPVGCGKTTSIAKASYEAFVERQNVHSFMFCEQGDLLRAYRAQYGDADRERREEATKFIELLSRVDLLVVDEMFSFVDVKNPWTATAAQDLGDVFRHRFAMKRKTLFGSNQDPRMDGDLKESLWARTFDERMADRARIAVRVVHVRGKSLRDVAHTLPLPFDK